LESENPEFFLRSGVENLDIGSVIDIGTGHTGVFDYWHWQEADLSHKACLDVSHIRPDIHKSWVRIRASATDMPLRNGCFDLVQSTEMIEHISPDKHRAVLCELKRVSRKAAFVTSSGLYAHLGEPQREAEAVNPFQEYLEMVDRALLLEEGFKVIYYSKREAVEERLLKLFSRYAPSAKPVIEHVKALCVKRGI